MRQLIAIFSISLLMSATCQNSTSNKNLYIRGKVSYRSCATIAVQVLEPKYYYIAEDKWHQAPDKPAIEHVFAVANPCSFPADYKPGDAFYFALLDEDPANKDCAVCELYDNPPAKKQLIKVIVADKQ